MGNDRPFGMSRPQLSRVSGVYFGAINISLGSVSVLRLLSLPALAAVCLIPPVDAASEQVLAEDDFSGDLSHWVVEQTPSGKTAVIDGKLDIDDAPGPNDKGGCTVWYKEKFSGPIMIEYDAVMVGEGGPNDRCSDLNCFWMATDPKNPDDLFAGSAERAGNFKKYDPLRLYYVGYGANGNVTTRFRRYPGDGTRPLDEGDDLSDAKFMNVPNKTVKIRLVADGKKIQFYRDGELIFDKTDPEPFTEGWFGFRTVRNHVRFDNFRVTRLPSP